VVIFIRERGGEKEGTHKEMGGGGVDDRYTIKRRGP